MYLGVDVRFRRSFLCHTSVIAEGEAARASEGGGVQGPGRTLFNSKTPFGK